MPTNTGIFFTFLVIYVKNIAYVIF